MAATFDTWVRHFQANTDQFTAVRWQQAPTLKSEEKTYIMASIQQFERGEGSEGNHLRSTAKAYAKQHPEHASYEHVIELFIAEENRHSWALRTFMNQENIPTIPHHWIDHIFRFARRLAGIEMEIRVLVTAEIIAMAYYDALRKATDSPTLQNICDVILRDEQKHLEFQAFALSVFNEHTSRTAVALKRWLHAVLMAATIVAVWATSHKAVFRRGGYGFWKYAEEVMRHFWKVVDGGR